MAAPDGQAVKASRLPGSSRLTGSLRLADVPPQLRAVLAARRDASQEAGRGCHGPSLRRNRPVTVLHFETGFKIRRQDTTLALHPFFTPT